MNLDNINNYNFDLNNVRNPLHVELIAAKNSGDEESVEECILQLISTFVAKGEVSYEDEYVSIFIEKMKKPFIWLSAVLDYLEENFDHIELNLKLDASEVEAKDVEIFLSQYGFFVVNLMYKNRVEERMIFNSILEHCQHISTFKIASPVMTTEDLKDLDCFGNLEDMTFINCSRLSQLPELPNSLLYLTIKNCENLKEATNIPEALTEVIIEGHDEPFRATLLSSFFNIDMERAVELFDSFQITSYQALATLMVKWNYFSIEHSGTLIHKMVLKPFRNWLKEYKRNILERLYISYKKEIPEGKRLDYSLCLKKIIDEIPISRSGNILKEVIPLEITQEETLNVPERFVLEKSQDIKKKIVYPSCV